jgi:DNA-binding NarL/FixJ family response regulator
VRYQILIADDHQPLRSLLKATLERHPGWHVCAEASNGLEAVHKAAECKPDLIILDLSMPVMGGLEAARAILEATPHMPILLFTNHAMSAVALDAQKIGIRQVLSKTDKEDKLVRAVESHLQEKSMYAAATVSTATPAGAAQVLVERQVPAELLSAGASAQAAAEKTPAHGDPDQVGGVNSMETRQTPNESANLPGDTGLPK